MSPAEEHGKGLFWDSSLWPDAIPGGFCRCAECSIKAKESSATQCDRGWGGTVGSLDVPGDTSKLEEPGQRRAPLGYRDMLGLLAVPPSHPLFSFLQTSMSVRMWMSQCPYARAAPVRTQKAPTAAAACQAMWHWPSPTTVCLRQPRARQQHSSKGVAVGGTPLWWHASPGPGGVEKGPRGCGCFYTLCPFTSKAHNSPATFSWL